MTVTCQSNHGIGWFHLPDNELNDCILYSVIMVERPMNADENTKLVLSYVCPIGVCLIIDYNCFKLC